MIVLARRLTDALSVLDRAQPIPAGAEDQLKRYSNLVGNADANARNWMRKIARVHELVESLSVLDAARPIPASAVQQVSELRDLIGVDDPRVARWTIKLERVAVLTSTLRAHGPQTVVLPTHALEKFEELRALVGDGDESVAALAKRFANLKGPEKPAWAAASGRDQFGLWADLTISPAGKLAVTQRFRHVPAGQFIMGSPFSESARDIDETQTAVTVSKSFWMADSECTLSLWRAISGAHHNHFTDRDDLPIERVSWNDCKKFISQLNVAVPNLHARMPSEAEWEFACRAGVDGAYIGPAGAIEVQQLDAMAWYDRNAQEGTHPVKQRQCNALGLYDMQGNVWEWCEDLYGSYSVQAVVDPLGNHGSEHVLRGGSWGDPPALCRAANRVKKPADFETDHIGLRLAADESAP